jgi:hypothetical protein
VAIRNAAGKQFSYDKPGKSPVGRISLETFCRLKRSIHMAICAMTFAERPAAHWQFGGEVFGGCRVRSRNLLRTKAG